MKIKANHYAILRDKMNQYLNSHHEIGLTEALNGMRQRWDIYWNSGTPITNASEFHYLNDDHIDTAIKAILRERIAS